MQDVKKINNKSCDKCGKDAKIRVNGLRLCGEHEQKLEERVKERIKNKYEGMSVEQIREDIDYTGLLE
jgi:hypothetical protein